MIKVLRSWTELDDAGISREAQALLNDSDLSVGKEGVELVLLENSASTHPIMSGSASDVNGAIISLSKEVTEHV